MHSAHPRANWTDDEILMVAEIAMKRWPGGVANRGWDPDAMTGWLDEMQIDRLKPEIAILGLRAVVSNGFVPSVDQVREAARKAMPPITAAEMQAAEERARLRSRERTRHLTSAPIVEPDDVTTNE